MTLHIKTFLITVINATFHICFYLLLYVKSYISKSVTSKVVISKVFISIGIFLLSPGVNLFWSTSTHTITFFKLDLSKDHRKNVDNNKMA